MDYLQKAAQLLKETSRLIENECSRLFLQQKEREALKRQQKIIDKIHSQLRKEHENVTH